jgi:hypothetical protein
VTKVKGDIKAIEDKQPKKPLEEINDVYKEGDIVHEDDPEIKNVRERLQGEEQRASKTKDKEEVQKDKKSVRASMMSNKSNGGK